MSVAPEVIHPHSFIDMSLIGYSGSAVVDIYYAASFKPKLMRCFLHDMVVCVGVDAQIAYFRITIIGASLKYAMMSAI